MKQIVFLICLLLLVYIVHSQSAGIGVSLTLVGESCYDGLQNQNETAIDCGGICEPCIVQNQNENRGGSGSGSGSNYNPLPEATLPDEFTRYYFFVKGTLSEDIDKPGLAISNIGISFEKNKNNISISLKNLGDNLNIGLNRTTLTYQYFKIEGVNIKQEDFSDIKLQFRIRKDWLNEKNSTFEDFTLFSYSNGWKEVDTTYIGEDKDYYYFESNPDSFGYFVIAGKDIKEAKLENKIETPISRIIDVIEDPKEFKLLSNAKKLELIVLSICMTLLFVMGISHIYRKLKGNDEKEELEFEKKLDEDEKKEKII